MKSKRKYKTITEVDKHDLRLIMDTISSLSEEDLNVTNLMTVLKWKRERVILATWILDQELKNEILVKWKRISLVRYDNGLEKILVSGIP
jgi:hypothetical protein